MNIFEVSILTLLGRSFHILLHTLISLQVTLEAIYMSEEDMALINMLFTKSEIMIMEYQ